MEKKYPKRKALENEKWMAGSEVHKYHNISAATRDGKAFPGDAFFNTFSQEKLQCNNSVCCGGKQDLPPYCLWYNVIFCFNISCAFSVCFWA